MEIQTTGIEGLLLLRPRIVTDARGWFMELFKDSALTSHSTGIQFVQENISYSRKNVLRGLHLQLRPFAQAKIITVLSGKVLDVVVDLRQHSSTFGKVFSCELEAERKNLLLIPEGFAHGFSALEDSLFYYKCSNEYHPQYETGIKWDDPDLSIDWKLSNPVLSEKDRALPLLKDLLGNSVISRD